MINLSDRLRALIEEGKAEFIGKFNAEEGEGSYKAYYRVVENGQTYYIYDLIEKEYEANTTLQ